jgi:hypothetical protein
MAWPVALGLVVGCVPPRVPEPPHSPPPPDDAGLVVTLAWSAPVDPDLYVTVPGGETFYYANPGRAFTSDVRCDGKPAGLRVEAARWRSPMPGRYRVGVDFPEACGAGLRDVGYRIVVDHGGRRVERDGTARLVVRNPAAFEVDVPLAPERP